MSQSGDDEVNRREVAYRLFAAEFDDADFSYAESDEERAPNYVVTPTGARVNRLFVVGVLTEVEQVNDDVVRARVVDPTGAFVVYAGQYQPEALAALESADTPSFVAVTGKARTFQPDDADVVYTSIRPESVSEVDADTRDRWVVSTAEQTVDRVATMAGAHARVERGDTLRTVLEDAGVEHGLAAGIPLALDHYGTTPAYLDAIRDLALDAARVVSGDLDAAGELDLAPDQGDDAPLEFAADFDVAEQPAADDPDESPAETAETTSGDESDEAPEASGEESAGDDGTPESPEPAAETSSPNDAVQEAQPDDGDSDEDARGEDEDAEPDAEPEVDSEAAGESADPEGEAAGDVEESADDGEMYELSEEERQEVEDNYDVGFSSGDDIPDAGESDIEAPEPEEGGGSKGETPEAEGTEAVADGSDDDLGDFDDSDEESFDDDEKSFDDDDESADGEDDDLDDFTEDEYDEPESDSEDAEAASMDLDLEDYVVDLMEQLDDGNGAPHDEVVATAADDRDADEGEVEDAIQDALMSGRCYESGDDHLKAI